MTERCRSSGGCGSPLWIWNLMRNRSWNGSWDRSSTRASRYRTGTACWSRMRSVRGLTGNWWTRFSRICPMNILSVRRSCAREFLICCIRNMCAKSWQTRYAGWHSWSSGQKTYRRAWKCRKMPPGSSYRSFWTTKYTFPFIHVWSIWFRNCTISRTVCLSSTARSPTARSICTLRLTMRPLATAGRGERNHSRSRV